MTKRVLNNVWKPLDEIEANLDAWASCPREIRALTHPEIVSLMLFADRLECYSNRLKRLLLRAEEEPHEDENSITIGGKIESVDDPILVKLRKEADERRDRAARILRRTFGVVSSD